MSALPIWPVERIEEALGLLGAGTPLPRTFGAIAAHMDSQRDLNPWLYAVASAHGLEAEPLRVQSADLEAAVRHTAPALLVVLFGVLAVRRIVGDRAVLLDPAGGERSVPVEEVCAAMRLLWERRYQLPPVESLLDAAAVPAERRPRARAVLLRELLASRGIEAGWTVRLPPSAPLGRQLRGSGLIGNVVRMALGFAASTGTALVSWALIGHAALSGVPDRGWLWGWALALATCVVLRAVAGFWQGTVSIGLGGLFKRRLLLGALRLEPSETRREGVGRFMSRVLDSFAVEDVALTGGLAAALALLELTAALALLWVTASASTALLLGGASLLAIAGLCAVHARRAGPWTRARLTVTHELVENLVGHRTRLAQQDPDRWHDDEDRSLDGYAAASRRMDRFASAALTLLPRLFFVAGLASLAPTLLGGQPTGRTAGALGAILLGRRALASLAGGMSALVEAAIAWRNARALVRAGGRSEEVATAAGLAASVRPIAPGAPLLEARGLSFAHERHRSVLRDASLVIRPGERVLVEGASGSGKSTLLSILTGVRRPDAGVLLLGGLDRRTLGAAVWRRRIAAAPQFHDNHVLSGTLAYNLLMGREWPPREADLHEAEAVCRELGLGPLVDRMPNGLTQMVGETGWRLSHGEQSRVFIARTLLQGADLIVLDESLAALDPDTLSQVMTTLRRRAPTLVVAAHP